MQKRSCRRHVQNCQQIFVLVLVLSCYRGIPTRLAWAQLVYEIRWLTQMGLIEIQNYSPTSKLCPRCLGKSKLNRGPKRFRIHNLRWTFLLDLQGLENLTRLVQALPGLLNRMFANLYLMKNWNHNQKTKYKLKKIIQMFFFNFLVLKFAKKILKTIGRM